MRYCTFFFFFFSSPLHCGLLCCSSKLLQTTISPLDFFFQSFSGNCACTLVLLFFGHQRHHIINVSRSKCDYLVFSVFDMEVCVLLMKCILLIWQDGWSVQSYVNPHLFSSSWEMYLLLVAFEQLVQRVFWNRGISLQVQTVVAVYTVCCITPFFAELSLRRDEQHTLCTIV